MGRHTRSLTNNIYLPSVPPPHAVQFYGITEERFFTVLFGVSRALGVLSQVSVCWAGREMGQYCG